MPRKAGHDGIVSLLLLNVSAKGQRFILAEPVGEGADVTEPSIRVVMNWYEEFRDREQH